MERFDLDGEQEREAATPITLVVLSDQEGPDGAPTLTLAGRRSFVTVYSDAKSLPKYTCISYSCGRKEVPHPFAPRRLVSARALPALEATIRALPALEATIRVFSPEAIWLDALCVPFEDLDRTATLRKMGAIYGGAARVVVVLSSQCATVIEQIKATGALDDAGLKGLAIDDWVTRAWTYQECANSTDLCFCAEGGDGTSISGDELLYPLAKALDDYLKVGRADSFDLRTAFPVLDGLVNALVEWKSSGLAERTAYQVMAAVNLRSREATVEDRLDAMIGAVNPLFASTVSSPEAVLASLFMHACESKGDYSFIYASVGRSNIPGRTWQPVPGPLPAVLPWPSYGGGQRGEFRSDHLELRDMARSMLGTLDREWAQFVADWLGRSAVVDTSDMSERVLKRLREMGFSGSGEHVELVEGLFFPQGLAPRSDAAVVIATGVRWVHGAPALVLRPGEGGTYSFGDVGVFVGPVPTERVSVHIV